MYQLENELLIIGIKQKGAELCSIISKGSNREYLWRADPKFWDRHSCILFPNVGSLKGDNYLLNGKKYRMGQHGFVRDEMFSTVSKKGRSISLLYHSDNNSMKIYPYKFSFGVNYILNENSLKVEYIINNGDDREMLFSVGAHPGFICPLNEGERRSDYQLKFNRLETASSKRIANNGLIAKETIPILNNSDTLQISDSLFDDDALVFHNLKSEVITLINGDGQNILSLDFEGFPYLGIWSKNRNSPFVCIEPWYGIADEVNSNGIFEEKTGIEKLLPGQSFKCSHKITIH